MPKLTLTIGALCCALLIVSCSKHDSPAPPSSSGTPPNTPPNTPPAVSITQFSPQETEVDSLVTITGTGFSDTTSKDVVTFSDTVAVVQSATSTQLVVVVPKGASTGKIMVVVDGQQFATSTQNFVVGDHWTLMKAFSWSISDPIQYYFTAGSNFYIGTGNNSSGKWQYVPWQYDPADSVWTQKTDFQADTFLNAASLSISGEGYLLNGLSALWRYDTASGNWTQKASLPVGVNLGMVAFSVNGKGYVGLGGGSSQMWQYDPAADAWKQMGNFPGTANTFSACFVIGNYAYVGTGDVNEITATATAGFYQYDPSTDTWTQKQDFPGGARNSATGLSIGNMGYMGLGLDINGHWQSDFWQYNPASDSWMQKSNLPGGARFNAAGFSGANQGYVGFGEGFDQISPNEATSAYFDLWQYQP